ncbi:MAG: hypothetical protein AAF806_27390 [Bacteroidota bacterium]
MEKQELISDVIANNIESVFVSLRNILSEKPKLLKDTILLEGRYNQLKSSQIRGVLKLEEVNLELNRIRVSILEIINIIEFRERDGRGLIWYQESQDPYIVYQKNYTQKNNESKIINKPSILFVSGGEGDLHLVDEEDWEIIRQISSSFNLDITRISPANAQDLIEVLTNRKYDIVQLNVYDIGFNSGITLGGEQISFDGIINLLKVAEVKLLVLASCNSVSFATKLNGVINMIASTGYLSVGPFQSWEKIFYRTLFSGKELSSSFELSTSLVKTSICLMLSTDYKFQID